eukprot:4646101-Prymnesium_polylepis.3
MVPDGVGCACRCGVDRRAPRWRGRAYLGLRFATALTRPLVPRKSCRVRGDASDGRSSRTSGGGHVADET